MAGKFLLQWHTGRDLATSLPIYLIQIRLRRSRFFRRSLLGRKGRGTNVLSGSFFLITSLKTMSHRAFSGWQNFGPLHTQASHKPTWKTTVARCCDLVPVLRSRSDIWQCTELRGQLQKTARLPDSNGGEACNLALWPEPTWEAPDSHQRQLEG